MSAIVSVGVGLLGVIIGSASSWLLVWRQHQLSTVLDLHREFNSGQLARSRHVASKLVAQNPAKTYLELYQKLSVEDMADVWAVVYFYQRLWLLVKHRQIQRKYVPELFAENFYYWLTVSYESQLMPLDLPVARQVAAFRNWMDRRTTELERQQWREAVTVWEKPIKE